MIVRKTLCFSVNPNSRPSSSRFMEVAAAATAMLVRLIIFPITPPAELPEAIRTGFIPSALAVTCCSVPKSALAEVSLPVRKTPNEPSTALNNGKSTPVAAKARPSVAVAPDRKVAYSTVNFDQRSGDIPRKDSLAFRDKARKMLQAAGVPRVMEPR